MTRKKVTPEPPGVLRLGEGASYSMDTYETQVNNNVFVVGGTGAGKTRHVVLPNLLEASGSYVVTDPKGTLYDECKDTLRRAGYDVFKLNFADVADTSSAHYNPLSGLLTEQDILTTAHVLTYASGRQSAYDSFWDASTELLFSACVAYLKEAVESKDCTLSSLTKLIRLDNIRQDESPLDCIFEGLERDNPDSYAVKLYQNYKMASGRTLSSVQICAIVRVAIYDNPAVEAMTDVSTINMYDIGRRKSAVFLVVSDTDRSLDPLVSVFYSQLVQRLVYLADHSPGGRLPVDVRLILDDFATVTTIPDFVRVASSVRSRGISYMVMVQDETQLVTRYGSEAQTIIACCDTYVYMGSSDLDTATHIAIRTGSDISDVLAMPPGDVWICRRGQRPLKTRRIDLDKMARRAAIKAI